MTDTAREQALEDLKEALGLDDADEAIRRALAICQEFEEGSNVASNTVVFRTTEEPCAKCGKPVVKRDMGDEVYYEHASGKLDRACANSRPSKSDG